MISPQGYEYKKSPYSTNPFWDIEDTTGVDLPAGRKGQYLSLNKTTIESPTKDDLEWKDIDSVDLSNYYNKVEINNIENLQNTQIENKADKTAVESIQNSLSDYETKQAHQDSLNELTQTIDVEIAELNADIIPSRVILSESMKEGNSDKIYAFKRGKGTEEDPYNQAIDIDNEINYTLEDKLTVTLSNFYNKQESDARFALKTDIPTDMTYSRNYEKSYTFTNVNYIPQDITNFILHITSEEVGDETTTDVFAVYMTRETDGHFKGTYTEVETNHGAHIYSFDCVYVQTESVYDLQMIAKIEQINTTGNFGMINIISVEIMRINIGASADLSNYYTKAEVDSSQSAQNVRISTIESNENSIYEELASKADSSTVYTKTYIDTNYYTKSQTDSKLSSKIGTSNIWDYLNYNLKEFKSFDTTKYDWIKLNDKKYCIVKITPYLSTLDKSILCECIHVSNTTNIWGSFTESGTKYEITSQAGTISLRIYEQGFQGSSTTSKASLHDIVAVETSEILAGV